jgi:predicted membrane protein
MKKIVTGVIIIMLGAFLLFNNLGLLDPFVFHIVISWQTLLIAIGSVLFFDNKKDHHHKHAGAILVFIGVLFLLPKIFGVHLGGIIVPVLIISAGLYFIISSAVKKNRKGFFDYKHFNDFDKMAFEDTFIDSEDLIKREYVFTGSKERWTYGVVKNVEIEAVFSGVELDFTQMELSDEVKTVHIKVSAVFSGITLYVPAEWNILFQKTGTFGTFTDKRPRSVIQSAGGKAVLLEVEAVFGGGEIKCYE